MTLPEFLEKFQIQLDGAKAQWTQTCQECTLEVLSGGDPEKSRVLFDRARVAHAEVQVLERIQRMWSEVEL